MQDFPFILVSALRYALPRHSYAVSITADFLERHFLDTSLTPSHRFTIIREIEQHLDFIAKLETLGSHADFYDMDTRRWQLCLSRLQSLLEKHP